MASPLGTNSGAAEDKRRPLLCAKGTYSTASADSTAGKNSGALTSMHASGAG
eukprot:CAMPEP_0177249898 /NCGR_PEP_ID=MMETSP0367-20130122/53026_1 /TAXON_ID=447022 ORGANISM="Scrippsiella hangoei-like, Strain SHHI-4" /NCGR_SAMPLE_ID=MMETSP0367 /ASSEMBLY_ACC=CAM_ASM_000362 /LENGTH=51 /DNA_ID=CAMNT_0018702491 /DNA_START=27 /DNA_END=179 /DNA_ORIENTATION=+